MAVSTKQIATNNVTGITQLQTIDSNTLAVLKETLYPGAKDESIAMVLSYCRARKLDPIKKPVHLVPMSVKTGKKDSNGKDIYEFRDVVMPGIGLYRIEADRSGQYAGMSEPEFGEDITEVLGNTKMTYPKWCKLTVHKYVGDRIVGFTAKEFWKENYATKSRSDSSPNSMWEKRAYGQLAKCAEAQALRKAFPDVVGQDYTKEEMEGKSHPEPEEYKGKTYDAVKPIKQEEVITEHDIDQDLLDISWAETVDNLKEIYGKAYKFWMNKKHKENMQKCVDAKDKKLIEIESIKTETIDLETGEIK